MSSFKILALFGESGAGKDTIQKWLLKEFPHTHKIISYTTRPPRESEKTGEDYIFVTEEMFKDFIKRKSVLEFTYFNNWFYGTPESTLLENVVNIGVFNPDGIKTLLTIANKKEIDVLPIFVQTDDKIRLSRTLNREKSPDCEEICRRFLSDKEDFKNINFNYETIINNLSKEDLLKQIHENDKINSFLNNYQN